MSTKAASLVHGSEDGFQAGCKTRAGCENADSPDFYTCAEATIRRRADFRLGRLPRDRPIPKRELGAAGAAGESTATEGDESVHGTRWGYRRGCTNSRACPNWRRGEKTCAEARREYVSEYSQRRLAGVGTAIVHGTVNGYLLGCRDPRLCPGDDQGVSCRDSRADQRREEARATGVPPRGEYVPADAVVARVQLWLDAGHTIRSLASRSGCSRATISALVSTKASPRARITHQTAARLLGALGDTPPTV